MIWAFAPLRELAKWFRRGLIAGVVIFGAMMVVVLLTAH